MKKNIKSGIILMMAMFMMFSIGGCSGTEADVVSRNVSQQADNFNVVRRLTVINARTDKPLFELIGNFSIKTDGAENQLEVTCETGKNDYKKHFIFLNEYTMYVVEDIGGAEVDKYRYEVNFLPEKIVPIKITSND